MDFVKEWIFILKDQFKEITLLEGVGVLFGVAEVLFAKKNKVWLYPCGLISIVITAYIFFHGQLYAETLLQLYFFVMSVYGWVFWTKRKEGKKISYSSSYEWKTSVLIVAGAWGLLFYMLTSYTDSDVPLWDSLVSAFAWAGMWLLAKRKIENWIFLNVSNLIAIPLLLHKGFLLYSLLTIFLFVVAVMGYVDWKRIIFREKLSKV